MEGSYCFGIDVGGTTIKFGIFDSNLTLKQKWNIATDTSHNGDNILTDIAEEIDAAYQKYGMSKNDCIGIGIAVPGPVTSDGTVKNCVNLGWGTFNVEDKLSEMTGMHVCSGNDANIAAFGEMKKGGGIGYKNIVMVTIGTGVGGGVILDGEILSSTQGAAGEIGHMTVNPNFNEQCSCGKYGCLEQVASATGIVKNVKRIIKDYKGNTVLNNQNITAKDVIDAAKAGDELGKLAIDTMTEYLGIALSNVGVIVDPDAFVIGGGVSKAGKYLIDLIEQKYNKYAFHACKNKVFKVASLGNDAGIYGAAELVKHSLEG